MRFELYFTLKISTQSIRLLVPSVKMSIRESFVHGVATVTQGSVYSLDADGDSVETHAGTCVARWKLSQNRRYWSKCIHEDAITCLRLHPTNPKVAISSAFDGKIRIWERESFELISEVHIADEVPNIFELSPCGTKLATCLRTGGLVFYRIENHVFHQIAHIPNFRIVDVKFNSRNHLIALQSSMGKDGENKLLVFDQDSNPITEQMLGNDGEATAMAISHEGVYEVSGDQYLAIGWRNGLVDVYDAQKLTHSHRLRDKGPFVRMFAVSEDGTIFVENGGSKIASYSLSGEMNVLQTSFSTGSLRALCIDKKSGHLWAGNESHIAKITIPLSANKDGSYPQIWRHELSCCGVSFSPDGQKICSGDLTGNLFIWDSWRQASNDDPNEPKTQPVKSLKLPSGIRSCEWTTTAATSLAWCDGSQMQDVIMVGTFDGQICAMDPMSGQYQIVDEGLATVTCIRSSSWGMAASDTKGTLVVFDTELKKLQQHSICKDEIWSFSHHPQRRIKRIQTVVFYREKGDSLSVSWLTKDIIAVACEDTTTKMIDRHSGNHLYTLSCHSMAVTCVAYQPSSESSGLLATSSDDRRVVLHRVDITQTTTTTTISLASMQTLTTHGLYVTYCALQSGEDVVACVTLDGFVHVWRCSDGHKVFCRKRHIGSIEGLAMSLRGKDLCVATVGSDCTLSLMALEMPL